MKPTPRQRITIASVALGAGLLLLGITPTVAPLERADRALVGWLLARTGADATSLHGTGSHEDPRRARGAPSRVPAGDLLPPRFLAITDDPQGLFESRPPGPLDLAFVLEKLHGLGHRQISSSSLLAWENVDLIAVGALDHEVGRFQPAVIGAPLVRGLSDEPMPPAFERLSLPLARINGDTGTLPIVNRVAVPGLRFGGDSTWAAFTRLESESAPPFADSAYSAPVPLLARWGQRVVVALPLAHMMARFEVSAGQLVITPGTDIRLGESGPIIPIDIHGQTPVRPGTAGNAVIVPAEELVRPAREQVPDALHPDTVPLILRDDRTDAPAAVKEYSAHLGEILVALDRAPRAGLPQPITRPDNLSEILLLGLLAGLVTGVARLPAKFRHPGFAALAAAALAVGALLVSLLLVSTLKCTPPPLAMLGVPLAGWLVTLFLPRSLSDPEAMTKPEPAKPDNTPAADPPSKARPGSPITTRKAGAKKSRRGSRKSHR